MPCALWFGTGAPPPPITPGQHELWGFVGPPPSVRLQAAVPRCGPNPFAISRSVWASCRVGGRGATVDLRCLPTQCLMAGAALTQPKPRTPPKPPCCVGSLTYRLQARTPTSLPTIPHSLYRPLAACSVWGSAKRWCLSNNPRDTHTSPSYLGLVSYNI